MYCSVKKYQLKCQFLYIITHRCLAGRDIYVHFYTGYLKKFVLKEAALLTQNARFPPLGICVKEPNSKICVSQTTNLMQYTTSKHKPFFFQRHERHVAGRSAQFLF